MDCDGPGVDRAGERLPVAVDNIAAFRDQGCEANLTSRMITEGCKPKDPQRNKGDDPGVDQHPEHESLVHHREHLPALTDESKPLGPWRDESGRRCVHRARAESLADLAGGLLGRGASGSVAASRTGLITGFALAA